MTRQHYPIVFETEASGAISAYVPGLPVYAQAPTRAAAERAIQSTLLAYMGEHPETTPSAEVKVARVERFSRATSRGTGERLPRTSVGILSAAALVGATTSKKKRAASRQNGRLGGRPRKTAAR